MEKEIRIQDDLYEYVNHEWLEKAVIPDDKPTAGGFSDLATNVEELLMGEFKKMKDGELEIPNSYLANAVKLYAKAIDTKRRNKEGIRPILKTLKKIEKLNNMSSFNRNLADFVKCGIQLPFSLGVDADMKDTLHHVLMISGPSTILPDTTFYKEGMEAQKEALLGIWTNMVKTVLSFTKLTEEDIDLYIKDALAFDSIVASLVKSSEEWSEYTKMYNPMKTSKVCSLLKPVKFKKLLVDLFEEAPEKVIVADPRFLKGFKTLFNEETFVQYKHWAYILTLLDGGAYLSEKLRSACSMYQLALTGVAKVKNVEKFGYGVASQYYSEPLGLYYGEKYFGQEAKKDVVEMVYEIIDTYKRRVKENDFLEEATKEKAIVKLDKMVVKMGYPDKVDPFYDSLVFDDEDSFFEATRKLNYLRINHELSKLKKDVNKEEWVMPGHMVNACYNPFTNDITFPAAILQPPFYSIKQTRSENLGGIGAVIGHEISHAFDNNGAKCDEYGNINNWWTAQDNKRFNAKTKAMVKQFDGLPVGDGKVNGSLVVSENIADNGGMAVTLDIMSRMEGANYEEYFSNWAKVWCMKAKPEYVQLLLSVDVHSPAVLRANIPPRNFDEWYDTFHVTSKDKMYIAPNKRIKIW